MIRTVATTPFDDQKPGTSGLRKKVPHFQQPHYAENFLQAILDTAERGDKATLVIGGDGRFFNADVVRIAIRMAAANGIGKVVVGQNGLLSDAGGLQPHPPAQGGRRYHPFGQPQSRRARTATSASSTTSPMAVPPPRGSPRASSGAPARSQSTRSSTRTPRTSA